MNQDLVVSKTILVNASPTKVWAALTTPEIIKEYLYGTETITDWKVGSSIVFQGEYEGHKYRDHGVILKNDLHSSLSYSYWSGFSGLEDKPENYSTVTYVLEKKGDNATEFTWIQKGYASEENQKHSENGMLDFLMKFKEVAEK